MTTPLTAEERASMRVRVDTMPRAPWEMRDDAPSSFSVSILDRDGNVIAHVPSYDPDLRMAIAYNLIHFRTDIPRLLDHAEAQDAEVTRLKAENKDTFTFAFRCMRYLNATQIAEAAKGTNVQINLCKPEDIDG